MTVATGAREAIVLRGLTRRYGTGETALLALDGMDLTVARGEFVSLVGPSGCGKTTLLRTVAGLLDAEADRIEVMDGSPGEAVAAHALGLVSQDPGLFPWRTVAENVALSQEITGNAGEGVAALLTRVDIAAFANYYPRELSGGMRQRVALARALAHRPSLLLMDEPFGALDELSREELCLELLHIWERDRVSVLFVTHSIREAVLLSDRVVVMSRAPGRTVADVPIDLPRPRDASVQGTAAFAGYVSRIRIALGLNALDAT